MSRHPATERLSRARQAAAGVADPELPDLTVEDLGILRHVREQDGVVVVTVTPTFSGCPAISTILADIDRALAAARVAPYRIETALRPAWTSDWITASGRQKLVRAGIAPPAGDRRQPVTCPQCGSKGTALLSWYAATPCRALHRCTSCREPFDAVKPA